MSGLFSKSSPPSPPPPPPNVPVEVAKTRPIVPEEEEAEDKRKTAAALAGPSGLSIPVGAPDQLQRQSIAGGGLTGSLG
jgi:hypothetical protein